MIDVKNIGRNAAIAAEWHYRRSIARLGAATKETNDVRELMMAIIQKNSED